MVANDPTLLFVNPWRYPPLYFAFTAPALLAKTATGSTLVYLATLKIPLAIADAVSAFYLFKILTLKFPRTKAFKFTALYAFNPLVIFESAGGGFNDPIPIAFTVIAFYYLISHKEHGSTLRQEGLGRSAFFLGLGVATKLYPLLLLPVFVKEIRGFAHKMVYCALVLLPIGLVSTPFMASDFTSYTSLLITRSVGGQHPLIPFANLGGAIGPGVIAALALVLLWTYLRNSHLTTRVCLVFLWVNVAIFGQSLNYMIWGIPFFTILAAQNRKLWGTTITPVVTFVTALIFQGWYNGTTGETGLYYWADHLLHQENVVFRTFPLSSIDSVVLVTTLLSASVLLSMFYFVQIARTNPSWSAGTVLVQQKTSESSKSVSWSRPVLVGAICTLVLISWSTTAIFANFQQHNYPTVQRSIFEFKDRFQTPLLDYQWAVGGANYSINQSQGYLTIADQTNSTGFVYRGWQTTVNGFYQSSSYIVNVVFRFRGFLPGRHSMVIANMTDGLLVAQQTQTNASFQYQDLVHDQAVPLAAVDFSWHNFTERFSQGTRTLQLDYAVHQLTDGNLSKLVLGDYNSGGRYGGSAEFSNITVIENDFPSNSQSAYFGWTGLSVSFLVITAGIILLSRRLSSLFQKIAWRIGARYSSI